MDIYDRGKYNTLQRNVHKREQETTRLRVQITTTLLNEHDNHREMNTTEGDTGWTNLPGKLESDTKVSHRQISKRCTVNRCKMILQSTYKTVKSHFFSQISCAQTSKPMYLHSTRLKTFHTSIQQGQSKCIGKIRLSYPLGKMLYMFLCMLALLCYVDCQTCSDEVVCYPPASNLVKADNLEVSSTCGTTQPTIYRKTVQTQDYTSEFVCDASNPLTKHSMENMIDGKTQTILDLVIESPALETYWQSENSIESLGSDPLEEFVLVDMQDEFLIRFIQISFVAPELTQSELDLGEYDMRPVAMVIERKETVNSEWVAWRYFARSCSGSFPGVLEQTADGPDLSPTQPFCIQIMYTGDTLTYTGLMNGIQQVEFNPSREYNREFVENFNVQSYFMATAVRLRFVAPSNVEPLSSYYAIADLEINGQCACFGHASSCSGPNSAECVCEHNTQGAHCEECLPTYNNRTWQMGYEGFPNPCEDCGCNGHALSCHYDAVKGYGVCDSCVFPTAGDKCEFCLQHYYVNPASLGNPLQECVGYNGSQYIVYICDDYCIPCNCSLLGSVPSSGYSCDNFTGQCECKELVMGQACDECKDEYWSLSADNPQGCLPCVCDASGTVNNSQLCDKITGQCICKEHTHGSSCSQCQEGYFGMSEQNEEGCTLCDCDPGAASVPYCPVDTGQCECRAHIGGRTCRQPDNLYYVPRLDHLVFDAEFTSAAGEYEVVERAGHGEINATCTGRGFLKVPAEATLEFIVESTATHMYQVVTRYETSATWLDVNIDVTVVSAPPDGATQYSCADTSLDIETPQALNEEIDPVEVRGYMVMGEVCLMEGATYSLLFHMGSTDPAGMDIMLDSVVLVPTIDTLDVYVNASEADQAIMDQCHEAAQPVDYLLRQTLGCAPYEYSIMAEVNNRALLCSCDAVGSEAGMTCHATSGQCPCKAGVMLEDCSQCQVDYYGYDTGQGCTACDCDINGSVITACNESGICECKANVTGIKCNSCIPDHYGLYTGNGCIECHCNLEYAYDNACADTGQCSCKDGIDGLDCDQCQDGYYNLTSNGCTYCGCDDDGSTSLTCNKEDGVCDCKVKVIGDKCNHCQYGYFALGQWSPDGCLPCFCSGHTDNCSSAENWYRTEMSNDWSLLFGDSAVETFWSGEDREGNVVQVNHPVKFPGLINAQFVMQILNENENLQADVYYFVATGPYLGDKRSAYANNLTFTLSLSVPRPADLSVNDTFEIPYIDDVMGDAILSGGHVDFKLVAQLPQIPSETQTTYTIQLLEVNWRVDTIDNRIATYQEMMQVLADLDSIHIRAKFTNASGAETDLYSASMGYATQIVTPGVATVNNVEQCICPEGYSGQFCEFCAPGYTREVSSGGPYVVCVPCNCYNHGSGQYPCDPETGVCNCSQNTMGDHCQLCQDGYYGDATIGLIDDCMPCMCPGNVVEKELNVFASTCELLPDGRQLCHNCTEGHEGYTCDYCADGYYGVPTDPQNAGGACTPCVCYGRAETCNSTSGMCEGCINNTAGKECDICNTGYFGDAIQNDCRLCECNLAGATGDCDPRDGRCVCKRNVVGFTCDQCGPNSYNYSSGDGCLDCDCHETGALLQSCNVDTGQCTCRTHVIGRACDLCEDTYWNINSRTGCDPCYCIEEGTDPATGGVCDLITGQCTCAKEGIIGRPCDHCADGTKESFTFVSGLKLGTYPDCEVCGECFDNWGFKIDEVGFDLEDQHNLLIHLWADYDNLTTEEVTPTLNETAVHLAEIEDSLADALKMVTDIQLLGQGLEQVSNLSSSNDLELDGLSGSLVTVQDDLKELQTFNGDIYLADGSVETPSGIREKATSEMGTLQSLYRSGNESWDNISHMADIVSIANGDVTSLKLRVNTAVNNVNLALSYNEAAENVLQGDFNLLHNNTDTLDALEGVVDGFPAQLAATDHDVGIAADLVTQANVTMVNNADLINAKQAEFAGVVAMAQSIKFNVSQAKAAADQMEYVLNNYLDMANTTRGDILSTLDDINTDLNSLQNITDEIEIQVGHSAEVSGTIIRPLSDMTLLTQQIEQIEVSSVEVQQVYDDAANAKQVAAQTQDITTLATEQSSIALSQVETTNGQLDEASRQRALVDNSISVYSSYRIFTQNVVNNVKVKASAAVNTAGTYEADITNIDAYISDIEACFASKQTRAQAAEEQAKVTQTLANSLLALEESNEAAVQALQSEVTTHVATSTQNLNDLQQVMDDMTDLSSTMSDIDGISRIEALLSEYIGQDSEMDVLSSELDTYAIDLSELISFIDELDPATSTCTHN